MTSKMMIWERSLSNLSMQLSTAVPVEGATSCRNNGKHGERAEQGPATHTSHREYKAGSAVSLHKLFNKGQVKKEVAKD
jgi:hypothetical protein